MQKLFSKTAVFLGLLTLGLAACEKDEVKVTSEFGPEPTLTASATNLGTLSKANAKATAVTYNWTPYTITLSGDAQAVSPVVYTLQLAKAGTNFAVVEEFTASSNSVSTLAISTEELNRRLLALKFPFAQSAQVDARLKTTVAGNLAPLYSASRTLTATPYDECSAPTADSWGLVGPAGDGWPGATATDRVMTYDCTVNAFVLKRTALNAGPFKFRANKDWGTNLGGAGSLTAGVPLTLNGADLTIATAGTYDVQLVVTLDASGKTASGVVTVK